MIDFTLLYCSLTLICIYTMYKDDDDDFYS